MPDTPVPIDPKSFRLFEFLAASAEEISARTVTCETCPVSAKCLEGKGGTGYVCPRAACRTAAVGIDSEDLKTLNHIYIIDCNQHRFHDNKLFRAPCNLCDGLLVKHELYDPPIAPTVHLVITAYSGVSVEARKKVMRDVEPIHREAVAARNKQK